MTFCTLATLAYSKQDTLTINIATVFEGNDKIMNRKNKENFQSDKRLRIYEKVQIVHFKTAIVHIFQGRELAHFRLSRNVE